MITRAYQIQVRGALDGSTAMVIPTTVTQDADGVIRIDAGVGINVGTIDLQSLWAVSAPTQRPLAITAFNVVYSDTTRAARNSLTAFGSEAEQRLRADIVQFPPLMPLWGYGPIMISRAGARLVLLTDDNSGRFDSDPALGPHFVYFQLTSLDRDEDETAFRQLETIARIDVLGNSRPLESNQVVAASASSDFIVLENESTVQSINASIGTAPAAGETMTVTISRVDDGTGGLTTIAEFEINNTYTANTTVSVPLDVDFTNYLNPGDRVRIARVYVAGGGPAPLTDTTIRVNVGPAAFPQAEP